MSLSVINEKGILNYIYHPKLKKKRDREKKEGRGYPIIRVKGPVVEQRTTKR